MTELELESSWWDQILLAWLHDPPDKALSIAGHVRRARDNAKIALGDDALSRKKIEDNVTDADPMAAVVERLPMPSAGESRGRAVAHKDGNLRVTHPLSAKSMDIAVPDLSDELSGKQREQLSNIVQGLPADGVKLARNRFLAVWRLWPDALVANCHPCFDRLPADTRTPDHTIWNHSDITAAFKAAAADSGGAALLAFAPGRSSDSSKQHGQYATCGQEA